MNVGQNRRGNAFCVLHYPGVLLSRVFLGYVIGTVFVGLQIRFSSTCRFGLGTSRVPSQKKRGDNLCRGKCPCTKAKLAVRR